MIRRGLLAGCTVLCVLGAALLPLSASAADPAEAVRLTQDGHFKQRPAWSPDGAQVVFARHEGSTIFLWVLDTTTQEERRLTERKDPEFDAVFSPDARELLLAVDNATPNQGNIDVYRLKLADGSLEPVADNGKALSHEEWPAWSPDGKQCSYTSTRDGNQEIYIADSTGANVVRVTSDPATDAHPCWSPDGRFLAFATDRWGDLEIALYDVQTQDLRQFTDSPGLDDYPAFSPDGRHLAFVSNRHGQLDILIANVETGNIKELTRDEAIDNFPTWTPDGRIGFVSNRGDGFDIYVQDVKLLLE